MKLARATLQIPRGPSLETLSSLRFETPKTSRVRGIWMLLFVFCTFSLFANAQTPGTATIGINGAVQGSDAGMINVVVNGSTCTGYYNPGDVDATIALNLKTAINLCSPYVTANTGGSALGPGGVPYAWTLVLTAKTSGSSTNYPLSVSIYDDFYQTPAIQVVPFTATLTGGTDAPAPIPGFINPKYIIVGVTYAPPGNQSTVTYLNSKLVGNTTDISHSFSDTTTLSISVKKGIEGWKASGIDAQAHVTVGETTAYTHGTSDTSTVTINKTTSQSDLTRGPANSFVGIDHDYDIIWLWLNPLLIMSYDPNRPNAITWNGYGFDPDDQPDVDILPVFVGWLNGDIPIPSNVAGVLARTWAANQVWPAGQGPGLTGPGLGTDFDQIVRSDPFWQCTPTPANCPTSVDLTRFTLSDNQNMVYEQPPPGGQPITQTYMLTYVNTSTQGHGTSSSFSQEFSMEEEFGGHIFGLGVTTTIKEANKMQWDQKENKSITQTQTEQSTATITGPTCTVSGNSCNPLYDGPVEFSVYQDNQYGTFMFFPVKDPRFRLSVTPASKNVAVGGSTTYNVSSAALDGFVGNIDLTVTSGLPANATASFSPTTIGAGGSSTLTITTAPNTPTGNFTISLRGTSGSLVVPVNVTLVVQDFSLSANPTSQSIAAGGNTTYTISTAGVNGLGFSDNVTLSVGSGLPSGTTTSFAPNPIAGVGSSTLSVTIPGSAAPGNYVFNVIGTDGTLSHSIQLTLTVIAPDFTISASPSSISILPGGCAVYTVTTGVLNGFTGTISLSQSGVPSGASAIFNPLSITGAGSSTLTVCTTTGTPAGSYTITITGINGSLIHSTAVILVVQDFSLSATPSSQTVTPGTGTTYTVSVAALNGFAGSVALSISGFPSGTTATFNPTSINGAGSSTLTVTTSTSTPGGTYPLTITGTSGSASHSISVNLIVAAPDFTIDATPASLSVTRGSSGNYTVTIGSISGFNGAVNLSVTGLPGRTTATFTPTSVTGSGTSTLRITVQSNATRGTSTLTIHGTSGSLAHTKTVTLVIQ